MADPYGKGGPGRKGRKGKHVVDMPPDPQFTIPKLGPRPGPPPLPKVNINTGIGKTKNQLARARRQGKAAAGSQLGTIADRAAKQIGKQERKFDATASRILRNARAHEERQRQYSKEQAKGIATTTRSLAASSSPGAFGAGLTGSRSRVAGAQARAGRLTADAGVKAAAMTRSAGQGAIDKTKKVTKSGGREAMSMLDVLAAERKSDDVRFIKELKHQERMQEISMAHDLQMAEYGFMQDEYMARLNNQLQMEYTEWQLDNDLLLTPEQEAALSWRYDKKSQLLSYKLEQRQAQKEGNRSAFNEYDRQMSAIQDASALAIEAQTTPSIREHILTSVEGINKRDKIRNYVMGTMATRVTGETELAAVTKAVDRTLERGGESFAAEGAYPSELRAMPTWEETNSYISEISPPLRKYIEHAGPRLQRYHEDYLALRTSQSPANPRGAHGVAISEGKDSPIFDAGGGDITDTRNAIFGVGGTYGAYKALSMAGEAALVSGKVPGMMAEGASKLTKTQVGALRATDALKSFVKSPGRFPNAMRAAFARTGTVNPLLVNEGGFLTFADDAANAGVKLGTAGAESSAAIEGSLAGRATLGSAGGFITGANVLATVGLVSHKIIDTAFDELKFAEAMEDENLSATIGLMDATAESIISGNRSMEDLDRIVGVEEGTRANSPIANFYTSDGGWDDSQIEIIKNRYAVLKPYIEAQIRARTTGSLDAYFGAGGTSGGT